MAQTIKPLSEIAQRHLQEARNKGVLEGDALREMIEELGTDRVMRLARTNLFMLQMPPGGLGTQPKSPL